MFSGSRRHVIIFLCEKSHSQGVLYGIQLLGCSIVCEQNLTDSSWKQIIKIHLKANVSKGCMQ